jgi:hypothetical protein
METIDPIYKVNPDTQLIAEIQKEYTLKKKIRKQRGLILFAIYPKESFKTIPVKITEEVAYDPYKKKAVKTNKAYLDPEAFYMWAINAKRAEYKLRKVFFEFLKRRANASK